MNFREGVIPAHRYTYQTAGIVYMAESLKDIPKMLRHQAWATPEVQQATDATDNNDAVNTAHCNGLQCTVRFWMPHRCEQRGCVGDSCNADRSNARSCEVHDLLRCGRCWVAAAKLRTQTTFPQYINPLGTLYIRGQIHLICASVNDSKPRRANT